MIDFTDLAKRLRENADLDEMEGCTASVVALEREAADALSALQAENAAVRQELEEARKNADRYRWLRQQNWSEAALCVVARPKDAVKLGYDCPSMERLDAEIDAAQPKYSCNACDWTGKLADTVMLGSVGPLCPECRETTDKSS